MNRSTRKGTSHSMEKVNLAMLASIILVFIVGKYFVSGNGTCIVFNIELVLHTICDKCKSGCVLELVVSGRIVNRYKLQRIPFQEVQMQFSNIVH